MAIVYATRVEQVLHVPQREGGKRIYIITASRMISGEVLKYLNGLLIRADYIHPINASRRVLLRPL